LGAGKVVSAHFAVSGEYVGEAVAKLGEVKAEGARAEAVKAEAWPLKVGGGPPAKFILRFLTSVSLKRGRVFDLVSAPHRLALSAGLHAARVLGPFSREVLGFSATEGLVRRVAAWAYGYMAVSKAFLKTAVVYADGAPQVGSVGWATYEVKGKRRTATFGPWCSMARLWARARGLGLAVWKERLLCTPGFVEIRLSVRTSSLWANFEPLRGPRYERPEAGSYVVVASGQWVYIREPGCRVDKGPYKGMVVG